MAIPRILEPEAMDTPDEAREYDAMDHSHVNRVFVDDLLAAGFAAGDLLDLGTGTALIPIELCRRDSECRVMATDLAGHMLDLASFNLELRGYATRVQLQQADAKRLPFASDMFDAVVSNSIVHHVPEPRAVFGEALRVTKPGGLLFFRDLFRPYSLEELRRIVEAYAGQESERARQLFGDSLHAALTVDEVRQLVGEFGFAADTVQATSDRHWTWIAHKPA